MPPRPDDDESTDVVAPKAPEVVDGVEELVDKTLDDSE
jgi:hypothetical protein